MSIEMKKFEAPTLEEAYKNAADTFNCSVTEITYEIIQYPSSGVMGLFKKPAIIVALKNASEVEVSNNVPVESKEKSSRNSMPNEVPAKEETSEEKKSKVALRHEILAKPILQEEKNKVLDSFFDHKENSGDTDTTAKDEAEEDDDRNSPENRALSLNIENKLRHLMEISCFDIDTVEVDVFKKTAYIFIDGEDAALLIGKEGYRYNAMSYMLFNWINAQFDLYIKLEIAEFIQDQEEMISNYLVPIIEHINEKGRGKTKPLDGILVQIALEQLRAAFPNKYVAIKTGRDGKKFIIINNFNSKKNV